MADKMRLTAHNGRAGKKGVYSPKHNDRNFNPRQSDHIDEQKSSDNWYWHYYQKNHPDMTFEEVEARYYEQHFRESLDARNQKSIDQRHPERVKSMDDYRASQKTCPEEQIMQIGKDGQTVDPAVLRKIAIEQINWEQKKYPNFRLLDVALHVDEQGAPHIHKRGVWIAHEDGLEVVGQAKALAEMGISAPDPDKKYGKYNNAKMTYTKECREHLAELCREHGLDLELTPKEHSKSGLALEEYKAQQEQEKARQAQQELEQARQAERQTQQNIQSMQSELAQITAEKEKAEQYTTTLKKAQEEGENELLKLNDDIEHLKTEKAGLEVINSDAINKLMKALNSDIQKANAIGDRVANEHLTLKKPMFGADNEVTLGSVQQASWELGRAFEQLQPVLKSLKTTEKKLSEMTAQTEKRIEKRAQEIVHQKNKQLLKNSKQAEKRVQEAQQIKQQYDELKTHEQDYIADMAQAKFDAFMAQNGKVEGEWKRMEDYIKSLKMTDGRTVYDAFKEHDAPVKQNLQKLWGMTM